MIINVLTSKKPTTSSLLLKGACVQTLGSRNKFCDPEQFQNYNPYHSVFLEETNFPHQILQIDGTGKEKVVSEAYFRQEDFAMWGTEDLTNDFMPYFTRYNSGEDVQSYAGAHFMPYLSEIRNKDKALVNYTGYYIGNALVPGGSTQGASESDMENIEKVSLLSIFMNEQSRDMMKTYLKLYTEKVSPFGCRSTLTLQFLKDAKIKSYFSACLTLMTSMQGTALTIPAGKNPGIGLWGMMEPNVTAMALPSQKEKTMILMIDCNNEGAIPKAVRDRAIRAGADLPGYYRSIGQKKMGRYNYSYKLLSLYANQAKVVITSRIHVGLPAAAMGVPVIFMKSANGKLPGGKQATGRVAGLLKVFHEVAPFEGKNWTFGDLTGEVPPNAGNHFADRYRASFWNNLRKTHFYRDTAKLYGMVPLQRLGMANIGGPSTQNTFHFVLQKDDLSWQTKRAIEHIFYFHPNARIYVNSNSINPEDLSIFAETGYDLIMQNYDIEELIENAFSAAIPLTQILHNRLSIYFLILWKYGGVYVSKNTMVVKELPLPLEHGVVMEEESGDPALIHLPKHSTDAHSFLMGILLKNEADQIKDWRIPVLSEEDTQKCIKDEVWSMDIANDDSVVAVSLHPTTFVSAASIKYKSVCYHVVEEFCIFCDEIHWDF